MKDISMNADFLLTYHDSKTPLELLLLLKRRYYFDFTDLIRLVELDGDSSGSLRVFNLIKQWLKTNFYDWIEDSETLEIVLRTFIS